MATARGNRQVSQRVDAVRCAREGIDLVAHSFADKTTVAELTSLFTTDGPQFYDSALQRVHELADEVERTRDPQALVQLINVSGMTLDRLTKSHLASAPGLETEVIYQRTAEGIKQYDPDGNEIGLRPYRTEV